MAMVNQEDAYKRSIKIVLYMYVCLIFRTFRQHSPILIRVERHRQLRALEKQDVMRTELMPTSIDFTKTHTRIHTQRIK